MKKRLITTLSLLCALLNAGAQSDDPVLMTINTEPVTRSEFEYAFNKNSEQPQTDQKAINEYLPLFVNYKLKVAQARELKMDTLPDFLEEFNGYRRQQADTYLIDQDFIEAEAQRVYRQSKEQVGPDGMLRVSHILVMLRQDATPQQQQAARQRIDSIYNELTQNNGNFLNLALACSDDRASAQRGSFWIQRGQTLKEFEEVVFALPLNEISKPFLSPVGYHIALKLEQKPFGEYDEYRDNIRAYLTRQGIEKRAKLSTGAKLAAAQGGTLTPEQALEQEDKMLEEKHPEFKNLMREYYEGSLCFNISSQRVWEKAARDSAGLQAYFKAHRKQYRYSKPRFKGAVLYCNSDPTLKKAQARLKKETQENYAAILRAEFNTDSLPSVKIERGYFSPGDNAWVDRHVFKQKTATGRQIEGYPSIGVAGKLQKKGPDSYLDVMGQVTTDYQTQLEQEWVAQLRQKYSVTINEEVLKTVNRHP